MTDGGRNVKKTAEQSEREDARSEEDISSLLALLTSYF
jgi:hypothetical protein